MKKRVSALSVKGQFTQESIPAMLEKVNEQIKALRGDREKATRIEGDLGVFGKVRDIKDPDILRGAYTWVTNNTEKISQFDKVFLEVDPSTKLKPIKTSGYSVAQWQEEILSQYAEITFEGKLKKLTEVKRILEENLSAESKLEASLKNVAEILSLAE